MGLFVSHHRVCQIVPKADLQKAFSALLMSPERAVLYAKQRDRRCQLEKSELCSVHGPVKELLCPQDGSAAEVALLPWAREAACDKQRSATCVVNEDVENGFCSRNGSVKEPHGPPGSSATWNKQKRPLRGFLGQPCPHSQRLCPALPVPVEWIRFHPVLTLVLILLLLLILALLVSLAVVSGRGHREIPVTPVTPVSPVTPDTARLLACPDDWIGHRGMCYFLSRDQLSWDQAQARCSELGASLAVLKDWEMGFLFCLTRNEDHWLGLRRQGRELQWGDGSSFNSLVPVRGNAECVYLAENHLGSGTCSNLRPFICSKPQIHL